MAEAENVTLEIRLRKTDFHVACILSVRDSSLFLAVIKPAVMLGAALWRDPHAKELRAASGQQAARKSRPSAQ